MKRSPFTRLVVRVVGHGGLKRLVLECGHSKELFSWVIPRRAKCETCQRDQSQPKARVTGAADR